MSTQVTISGSNYTISSQGDPPPWGDNLNSLLQAMVAVLNTVQGSNDISTTSFTLANNQASAVNVTGLSFDTSQVRSAIVSYSISRSTNTNESSECGQLYLTYKTSTSSWELAQYCAGSSGITFTITSAGQIQYTSTNISGTGYVGKLKFNAKTFAQT